MPSVGAGRWLQGSQQCRSGPYGPFRDPSPAGTEMQVAGASADHTHLPSASQTRGRRLLPGALGFIV